MNKVILMGRLGQDPELNYTGSGTAVANLRVATSESYKNKEGERVEKTEWHDVVAWGRTAEVIDEYFDKGDQILIEGSNQTRKWEDRDGNTRYSTEVKLRNFDFTAGSGNGNGSSGSSGGSSQGQGSSGGAASQPESDDELPF